MHAVQVSDRGVDERLKRRGRDALEHARHDHALELVARAAAPGRGRDQQDRPRDEHVALAPDAARGHDNEGGDAHAQKIPSCQLGDAGEGDDKVKGEGEGVCGEDGAQRGGEDGSQREDEGDEVALPERPVEGVVGVVAGLRDEDDGHRPAVVALEPAIGAVGGVLGALGVVKVSRGP